MQSEDEQKALDEALEGAADSLLVDSLQRDDHRRRKRRLLVWCILGLVLFVLIGLVYWRRNVVPEADDGRYRAVVSPQPPAPAPAIDPDNAERLNAEGWRLWQQQAFVEAEAKFADAVAADPKMANAWNGLGWSRFNQGKTEQGIEAFERCVAIADAHPAALNGLGQAYLSRREY